MVTLWKEQTRKYDRLRWVLLGSQSIIFRESALSPEDPLRTSEIYESFYQPNRLCYFSGHVQLLPGRTGGTAASV